MGTPRVRSRSEDRRASPGGGSRRSSAPTTTAGSLSVAADGPPEAEPIAGRRRGHEMLVNITSPPSAPPSAACRSALRAVSRILVTTSGELILLPVWERHPKLNLGQRPLTRYSHSDNLPLFSCIFPAFRTFRVQNGG